MSADAMDVGPVSQPEKKRKKKEKDGHSSKKRKHRDEEVQVMESPSKKDRKEKKKHRKRERGNDTDTETVTKSTSQVQQEQEQEQEPPSSTSLPKKKHPKRHRHKHSKSPSPAEQEEAVETSSTRKPLSKPTHSQLASLAAQSDDSASSSFHLVTTSLHLPLSPVSISATHALPSLLSEHVSPLLLTYFPPVRGIVLAYSNPSLSSIPEPQRSDSSSNPQPLTPAVAAGEYGVLYAYLNITFLVFRPERSQTFEGWINVQSESFLGAVVFNLFSVGIERRRLPADWNWIAPGQEDRHQGSDDNSSADSDKENFRPLAPSAASSSGALLQPSTGGDDAVEENDELSTGYFQTGSGKRVRGTIRFRLRDMDVIPGSERDKGFISLEGTMLGPEEEEKLVAEERQKAEIISGGWKTSREARMTGALSSGARPDASADTVGDKRKKPKE